MKIYICNSCKNIVTKLKDSGPDISCCGANMNLLEAGIIDAAQEKHVPVVHIEDDRITVNVGEVNHPMSNEHLIEWVMIVTLNGYQIKYLKDSNEPKASFKSDEKILEVYAYCNLHGLWKSTNV